MKISNLVSLVALCFALLSPNAEAKKVTVPINIGAGPAAFAFTGALAKEQPQHWGLHLDLAAVIDKKTIEDNKRQIPKKYRHMVKKLGEVKISHLLIPDALFISPRQGETAIYGLTLRPVAINQPLINKGLRIKVGAGLLLTYAHVSEETRTTNFFRPGIDFRARADLQLHRRLIISAGWSSAVYVPQKLGGFGLGIGEEGIWHVGQAFALLNFRIPFSTRI